MPAPILVIPRDADLLAVVATQPQALRTLYERYFPLAYRLAFALFGEADAAEECVQEVFLTLRRDPLGYRPASGPFRTWVLRAVYQVAFHQGQRLPAVPYTDEASGSHARAGKAGVGIAQRTLITVDATKRGA